DPYRGDERVGFFFQAEDGIRDRNVTGVQTCALPISSWRATTAGTITSKEATIRCQSPSSWASMITFASSNTKGGFTGLLLKCFHFPAKLRQTDPDKLGQFRA